MLFLMLALVVVFGPMQMLSSHQCRSVPREYFFRKNQTKPFCDPMPPGLGPIEVHVTSDEVQLTGKFPEAQWGGTYSPPHCVARHSVAIIVPYRNSLKQLATFLNHMHPFLMKQQIEYGIFIIEQKGMNPNINRGKLLNVGFVESKNLKGDGWSCIIFHDIDLLPLDQRNLYSCPNPKYPRHMAVDIVDKYNSSVSHKQYFGGVTALTHQQFIEVNGFSNRYWSYSGEDDDLYNRLTLMNYTIVGYAPSIARYASLGREHVAPDPIRNLVIEQALSSFKEDGLTNLDYTSVSTVHRRLFTHVIADIDFPTFLGS